MAAKRKYWWEEWFSKPRTVLIREIDYHCSQSAMTQMVRNNASQRGIRSRVIDTGNSVIIEVLDEIHNTDKSAIVV